MYKQVLFIIIVFVIYACKNSSTKIKEVDTQIITINDSVINTPVNLVTNSTIKKHKKNISSVLKKKNQEVLSNEYITNIITSIESEINEIVDWNDFYKEYEKEANVYIINNSRDTTITCNKGTAIKILSNSFISKKTKETIVGQIELRVTEYFDIYDMFFANLSTISNNKLLETGGMLYIEAIANNEQCILNNGKKIELEVPTKTYDESMQLFKGEWESNSINWQIDTNATNLNKVYDASSINQSSNIKYYNIYKNIKYPIYAMERGIQGKVYISLTVDREGTVKDAYVLKSVDYELDSVALDAVLNFKDFKPLQVNGENVVASYVIPITFKIDSDYNFTDNNNFKENFEKEYNDTTIATVSSNQISTYLFSTSELNWINIDKFYKEEGEKIDYIVHLKEDSNYDVKIIFHDIKSILSSFNVKNKYVFKNIPKNKNITIVVIKQINNQSYLAIKETNTSSLEANNLEFKPVTMQTLKEEIKKLNKF